MRRLLALLLLASFGLPVAASALALGQSPDTRLPACCRRNGAHHCAMQMAVPNGAPAITAVCPHFPQPSATSPSNTSSALAPPAQTTLLHLVALTATRQADTQRRISRERSRHKRGPPSISL
jgi:hypothetical protein